VRRPGGEPGAAAADEQEARQAQLVALRLLAARARTRAELERRLRRRFSPAAVRHALRAVERYVDDEAYARAWLADRAARRPGGARLLEDRLVGQGVPREVARAVLADYPEEEAAIRAASSAWRAYRSLPPELAVRRLWGFLLRRGFGHEAARAAVRRVLEGNPGGAPPRA
jgi:regulatory protein